MCASLEEEVSQLDEQDKREMLQTYGLEDTGLARVIKESNMLLGLKTFYTVGPQEARAWSFPAGMLVPQAAGIIHSDMERGSGLPSQGALMIALRRFGLRCGLTELLARFIKAETIAYGDFLQCGGEAGAKEAGKLRLEGKEYVVADGLSPQNSCRSSARLLYPSGHLPLLPVQVTFSVSSSMQPRSRGLSPE